MRHPAALIALPVLLLLGGCTTDPEPTSTPPTAETSSPTPTMSEVPTPTSTPTPEARIDPSKFEAVDPQPFTANTDSPGGVNFLSPSGNLGCAIGFDVQYGGFQWGCAIKEKNWEFPTDDPNDYCYDAMVPCGRGIEATAEELPHPRYRGDPGFAAAIEMDNPGSYGLLTLGYGKSVTWGNVSCYSEEDGVTCINNVSGHGFVISRDSNEIF